MMQHKNQFYQKMGSLVVAILFILGQVINPFMATVVAENALQITPDQIQVPDNVGRVKEVFQGASDSVVIHIQTAHMNVEVNQNIAKILEYLNRQWDLELVSMESWSGDFDDSLFKNWVDQDAVKSFGDWLIENAVITGAEYAAMTSKNIKLVGIEDEMVYQDNVEAWKDNYDFNAETPALVSQLENALIALRDKVFTEDSQEFAERSDAFRRNQVRLSEYVEYLVGVAESKEVSLLMYQMISKMKKTFALEDQVDYNQIETERLEIVEQIRPKLAQEDLSKLVTQSLYLRLGRVSAGEYYSYLENLAKDNGVDYAEFQNLTAYTELSKLYDEIQNNELYLEIEDLEKDLRDKVYQSEDQQTLDKLFRDVLVLGKLVSLKMTRQDLRYFNQNKSSVDADQFIAKTKELAKKHSVQVELEGLDVIDDNLDSAVSFYEHAIERDRIMAENAVKQMKTHKKNAIAFVAGGFHTDGIIQRLKDQQISYVIIAPRITRDDPESQERYEQALTKGSTDTLYQDALSNEL